MAETQNALIGELIKKAAGTFGVAKVSTIDAEVVSVDEETLTCIVNGVSGNKNLDGLKVRIHPDISDGEVNFPEEGSNVIIAFTDFTDPYIVKASWLKKKKIIIGDTELSMEDGTLLIEQGKMKVILKDGKINISNDNGNFIEEISSFINNICKAQWVSPAGNATLLPSDNVKLQQNLTNLKKIFE